MSDNDIFDDGDSRGKKKVGSREIELFSMRTVMKTENGRDFMWRCLQNCGTFENIFNENQTLHAYSSGARGHGLWLESELKQASLDNYHKMIREHGNE